MPVMGKAETKGAESTPTPKGCDYLFLVTFILTQVKRCQGVNRKSIFILVTKLDMVTFPTSNSYFPSFMIVLLNLHSFFSPHSFSISLALSFTILSYFLPISHSASIPPSLYLSLFSLFYSFSPSFILCPPPLFLCLYV